jgi:hypothetical protein
MLGCDMYGTETRVTHVVDGHVSLKELARSAPTVPGSAVRSLNVDTFFFLFFLHFMVVLQQFMNVLCWYCWLSVAAAECWYCMCVNSTIQSCMNMFARKCDALSHEHSCTVSAIGLQNDRFCNRFCNRSVTARYYCCNCIDSCYTLLLLHIA